MVICVLKSDGKRFVQNSVILLGEIGGNDYNIPLMLGMSPEILRSLAPAVVDYIGTTLHVRVLHMHIDNHINLIVIQPL